MKINDYLELGLGAVESDDGDNCVNFADKILDLEPKNAQGWYIKAVGTNLTGTLGNPKVKEYLYAIKNALKYSNSDDKVDFNITVVADLINRIDGMLSYTIQEYNNSRGFGIEASVNKDLFLGIHSEYVVHTWELRQGLTSDMLRLKDSFYDDAKSLMNKALDIINYMNIAEPSKTTMINSFSIGIEDYYGSIKSDHKTKTTIENLTSLKNRNINWFWMIFWVIVFWPGAIVYYLISKE